MSDALSPDEPTDDSTRHMPPNMVRNTRRILDHEDAVQKIDPDHFTVHSLRMPSRRVRVVRRGDTWRCRSDKRNNQDQPCSHILAVLVYEGLVELPNSAASVWKKGNEPRDQAAEGEAWRRVPTRLPLLLARLLNQGLPIFAPPEPPRMERGRPRKPVFPQAYQAILRVAFRQNLYSSQGVMQSLEHRVHNPYGGCGIATLSRFLNKPETTTLLEKLLALSTWPAKPHEFLVHPDGTGLTEQRFSAYFDERYKRKKKKPKDAKPEGEASPTKPDDEKPRLHHWTYAEFLWTYRYTMIAALHTQQGPFGEAPWLIPLLERARLVLDIRELGGDKAYQAGYIFDHARANGIDAQIKFKKNVHSPQTYARLNAMRKKVREAQRDPLGYAAKANRRNNAETGNHAFKAILGDQIYSKNAIAQRNEILCMSIAYNLTRLIFLEVERGIEADFASGVDALRTAAWVSLDALHRRYYENGSRRPEWA